MFAPWISIRSYARDTCLSLLALPLLCFSGESMGQFAKGADVSWITQMEASGYGWYNDNGTQQDVLQILKDHGMDTIRLRVWVDPADGWNGRNDVVAKAVRARNAGFRIMIDFHYSDSWADPGQQNKPAAWRTHTFETRSAGGLGVLYWEPQAYNRVGYTKGAWNADGRPTVALDAFLEGTQQPGAVTIQENSTGFCGVDGTIDNNNSGYSGTGFANTNNVAGASVRWRVNAATSGTYTLRWRFANGTTTDRAGSLRVNGATLGSSVALNPTGAWNTWANSASVTTTLSAGANDLSLVATTSGGLANIDSLTVTGNGMSASACN